MSISLEGMGEKSEAYDEFDIQTVRVELDSHSTVAGGIDLFEPVFTTEPLEGLARDEVAELVAIHRQIYSADDIDVDGPNKFEVQFEVSFDSSAHTIGTGAAAGDEVQTTSDVEGVTGIDLHAADTVDVDILGIASITAQSAFADNTNGDGGSGQTQMDWELIPYRNLYGEGPTVDRHDDLHYHAFVDVSSEAQITVGLYDQYVWDVRDC